MTTHYQPELRRLEQEAIADFLGQRAVAERTTNPAGSLALSLAAQAIRRGEHLWAADDPRHAQAASDEAWREHVARGGD